MVIMAFGIWYFVFEGDPGGVWGRGGEETERGKRKRKRKEEGKGEGEEEGTVLEGGFWLNCMDNGILILVE